MSANPSPLSLLVCAGLRLRRPAATDLTNPPGRARSARPALPHAPALDGLRALAVSAVLLYHAGLPWMPGGFLGVEVFFAISGYLITSLLLAEWSTTGRIDLAGFWLRRARRLLPALFALLFVVIAYAMIFLPNEVAGLRGDAVSSALYVNNWFQILSHKSYFENVGRPSLLCHLWSLAVEEQFYLIWPLLFCLLIRGARRATDRLSHFVFGITLAGAAISAAWMAMQYVPDTDSSRIYFGTDTRASGILIGAALAFLRMSKPDRNRLPCTPDHVEEGAAGAAPSRIHRNGNIAGFVALAVLTTCFVYLSEFQAFLYRGGFVLTSLATAALIAATVHAPDTLVSRIFAWMPLRWLGVRSYGIYLWHFPIFMISRPQLDVVLDSFWLLIARLAVTVLIAALSYRFLELPVRHGAIARFWQAWRTARDSKRRWSAIGGVSAVCAVTIAFGVLCALLFSAKPTPPPAYLTAMQTANNDTSVPDRSGPPEPLPPALPAADAGTVSGTEITAIGDSVMLGVRDELLRVLGTNVLVDAVVGRQARQALATLRNFRATGQIRPVVILHIGNNGFIRAGMFDQIMAELADARTVLVVNVKVPRQWESPNNEMLAEVVRRYPNTILVDWHAASENHPEIFWKDGHHLRPKGAAIYAALLTEALRRANKPGDV